MVSITDLAIELERQLIVLFGSPSASSPNRLRLSHTTVTMKISSQILTVASAVGFATTVSAQALKTQTRIGCFSSAGTLKDQGPHTFQSTGYCQNKVGTELKKPVMGLTAGSNCWAGDEYPPKDKKVDDSLCNINCQGFPDEKCKSPLFAARGFLCDVPLTHISRWG